MGIDTLELHNLFDDGEYTKIGGDCNDAGRESRSYDN